MWRREVGSRAPQSGPRLTGASPAPPRGSGVAKSGSAGSLADPKGARRDGGRFPRLEKVEEDRLDLLLFFLPPALLHGLRNFSHKLKLFNHFI